MTNREYQESFPLDFTVFWDFMDVKKHNYNVELQQPGNQNKF